MLSLSSTEKFISTFDLLKPVPRGRDPRRPNPTRGRDHPSARPGNCADYVSYESRLAKTVPFRPGAASPNATLGSALPCCPLIGVRAAMPLVRGVTYPRQVMIYWRACPIDGHALRA